MFHKITLHLRKMSSTLILLIFNETKVSIEIIFDSCWSCVYRC